MLAIDVVFFTLFCETVRLTLAVLPCLRRLPMLGSRGKSCKTGQYILLHSTNP